MYARLKLALFQHQAPQYEVAAAVGISETRLSRIVLGRITPTEDEKVRIARYLNCEPDVLFTQAGGQEPSSR